MLKGDVTIVFKN